MVRLIISMLCALGLAFAPAMATAAAMDGSMPGCTMGKDMPNKRGDHGKMDCCTPACQAPSAAAILPSRSASDDQRDQSGPSLASAPMKELASMASSGLDPPPRA